MRVTRVLLDDAGVLRRAPGRLDASASLGRSIGGTQTGATVDLASVHRARAGRALQDRLRRAQLPRPRHGDRARPSRRHRSCSRSSRARSSATATGSCSRPRRRRRRLRSGAGRGHRPGHARIADERTPSDHVFGYTCVNDVSARDAQVADGQWVRAKSFDTFCPVGPWITTADEIPDPQVLAISTT